MGVSAACYGHRRRSSGKGDAPKPFTSALDMLEHARTLGGGGVQTGVGGWRPGFADKMRTRCESHGLWFEGQVRLPRDQDDVARFDADLRSAKAAGAVVVRSVALSGRRYEVFETADAFKQFKKRSYTSIELAEPVARKHGIRLAIENHKDWRIDEFQALLKHIGSEHVGVCVDTGNSIALLEDPLAVVEAYAPHAFACHLKDMAVLEYADGFLLAGVPLGRGLLDLAKIVQTLRGANPGIKFSLEMITRDPLKVPCLTGKYWATMQHVPGRALADTLNLVRKHQRRMPLPRVTGLTRDQRAIAEEKNIRASFAYAREKLGL